jgi:hypothetical protein
MLDAFQTFVFSSGSFANVSENPFFQPKNTRRRRGALKTRRTRQTTGALICWLELCFLKAIPNTVIISALLL